MIRTLYFSTAHADLNKADIDAIVAHAAQANLENGISGALVYNGRNFCQCLEGDEPAVRALLETISKDNRHSGMKVIDEKTITDRYFADWSMRMVDGLDFSTVIEAMNA